MRHRQGRTQNQGAPRGESEKFHLTFFDFTYTYIFASILYYWQMKGCFRDIYTRGREIEILKIRDSKLNRQAANNKSDRVRFDVSISTLLYYIVQEISIMQLQYKQLQ